MELKQAIEICTEMQKWRRGEDKYDGETPVPMPFSPTEFGEAIDTLIEKAQLSWEDIKAIIRIADKLVEDSRWCDLLEKGEESYYRTILKTYNENKQKAMNEL